MSGQPSDAASGSVPGPSTPSTKAISSLAKKQADVTRQGTQKLKFVPTLPVRRKKEAEVKPEPTVHAIPAPAERGRGRGRGRGEGRGRGRGAPRPAAEMTASGPFAMGPAMAGNTARRAVPRSNFAPIAPMGPGAGSSSALGAGLSRSAAPSLKKENDEEQKQKAKEAEEEMYSDPDEGVEIIDMDNVRQMDWMAPESLRKDRSQGKKKKVRIKSEDPTKLPDLKGKGRVSDQPQAMDIDDAAATGEVNLANALDLSDSEEEEELEDLIEDFALEATLDEDPDLRQERLYFFQFPSPFPTFLPKSSTPPPLPADADPETPGPTPAAKKVAFTPDTKAGSSAPGSSRTSAAPPDPQAVKTEGESKVDGVIGRLEIYQSGIVKMRLGNGIVLDVTAATQPSFLQHAVHLDMPQKRLSVLGEVNKRFVVSPNVESLLSAMEVSDRAPTIIVDGEEDLIRMDAT